MKRFLCSALFALAATGASANVITSEVYISNTDPGSVQYVAFDVTGAGTFNIGAEGSATLGALYNEDPEIYLFSNSLSLANLIGVDDDGGEGYNALISNISLALGHYILAVSEFQFEIDEAIAGVNADSVQDPGLVRISISSQDGSAGLGGQVPEPASLALLGFGLFGLAAVRRKHRN